MNPSRWRLDGQVALVSGASKGIGYACVRELAALGADVLLVSRDEASLEHARSELAEEFEEREFDSLVLATTNTPEDRLTKELADAGLEVHTIGDAVAARSASMAFYEGRKLALAL